MSFDTDKTPFFSIIVPVYNTNESYLKSAIESVINQTFKDFELIIIDDASTVNYKIPENIKYIRNETNKGTLYSRKIGAINSNGKYIIYLDSDDRLTTDALQVIYDSINKEYDIIHFSAKVISSNENKKERIKEEKKTDWYLSSKRSVINEDYLFNECLNEKLPHNMFCKAFKSEIVKETIKYLPDSHLIHSEDMLQCLITIYFCKSYKAISNELYIYGNDSGYSNKDISKITIERFEKACSDTKATLNEFYNFLCSQKAEILHYYDYLKLSFNQYKYLTNKTNNEKIYLDILNKYFDNQLIEEYERFEKIHQYYLNPLYVQEEINKKLLPYFFSVILYSYYINIRIFGIAITIKTNKCHNKPIVISFNNLLKNIFSISSNSKEFVLRFFGLKFIKRSSEYGG
ncbi:glycosyltransferase family 2 protein [Brachyspira catarrhinii]|uniref:Glycosyltransferase n=1 Tax=Brachyspira catarrhinii TaxID=2528966 RepID=A0ABY2TSE7_9SPIR|nr:glycosyltransferase [Brachyspira catarrhinii]TKZ33460.1 glycosyltransferase [Brachyspira catarrhinii]